MEAIRRATHSGAIQSIFQGKRKSVAMSLDEVIRQMEEAEIGGLTANDLQVDGLYHRFRPDTEHKKKKSGWYKLFKMVTRSGREVIVGAYGRGPNTFKVRPAQTEWTIEEREEFKRNLAEREREIEKGRKQQADEAAEKAKGLWERFKDRIWYIHLNDCRRDIAEKSRAEGWDYFQALRHGIFCELGKGCVDFPKVLRWLKSIGYQGYVLVEQDVLPGMGAPKNSALRNREYLRSIEQYFA